MIEILNYLRDLNQNNNREWFEINKSWYRPDLNRWKSFCLDLIGAVCDFDYINMEVDYVRETRIAEKGVKA